MTKKRQVIVSGSVLLASSLTAGLVSPALSQTKNAIRPENIAHANPAAPPPVVTLANVRTVEKRVRELTVILAKQPDNKDCQFELARGLEGLAAFAEIRHDYMYAARYYASAAKMLNDAAEKSWQKRAQSDKQKCETNRQLRAEHLKNLELVGFVFTSFDWRNYKNLDRKQASVYMSNLGLAIRRNWSLARRTRAVQLPGLETTEPRLIVSFNVRRDGTISDIGIKKSCGQAAVDTAAMAAVKAVAKAPPLLAAMGEKVLFEAQFVK